MNWNPYTVKELTETLEGIDGWFLDGGHALDVFLGKVTRTHHDIDIGVFSSQVEPFLENILEKGLDVYVANRNLVKLNPLGFKETDYNYWVSDESGYRFQVLVYAVDEDFVHFRRNNGITWPKSEFLIRKNGVAVVNPLVSYAFKVTTKSVESKDIHDIAQLTAWLMNNSK
jgi:hypothetical protein